MNATFKQDRQLSRDTLVLEGDRLVIVSEAAGLRAQREIWLRDILPAPRRVGKRFPRLVFVPLLFAVAMVWAIRAILAQHAVDHVIVTFPVVGLSFAIWYVFRGFRPVDTYQMIGKNGNVMVEVYGPKGKRLGCAEFVDSLCARIAALSTSPILPNQLPDPTSPSDTPAAGAAGAPSVAADH